MKDQSHRAVIDESQVFSKAIILALAVTDGFAATSHDLLEAHSEPGATQSFLGQINKVRSEHLITQPA